MLPGNQFVEQVAEIAAEPACVWELVSTGAGISRWFVPAEVAPGPTGWVRLTFAPGAEGVMPIQEWDPPRTIRFGSVAGGGRVHEFDVRANQPGGTTVRVRDWGLEEEQTIGARQAWRGYLARLILAAEGQ